MSRHIEVIARALLFSSPSSSRVLLCQSVKRGYLYLPGGHVEFNESAPAALARELREEAGLDITPGRLVFVSEERFDADDKAHHELNLVFFIEQPWRPELDTPSVSSPQSHTNEQESTPRAPGTRATVSPLPVDSLESGIRFVWADLASCCDLDLRPLSIKAWLAAGAPSASDSGFAARAPESSFL